jgi:hypothetical protein
MRTWVAAAVFMGLSMTCQRACGQDKESHDAPRQVIFMFNWSGRHWIVGEKVPLQFVSEMLFVIEPCPLDFAGSQRMRRAWHFHDVGCWAPTSNGGHDFASSIRGDIENISGPLEYMVHGEVQPDSSVLITEPDFDSLTFPQIASQRIAQRQAQRLQQLLDARP